MNNEDEMMDHKKSVIMDLLSKMKELQSDSLHGEDDKQPHAMEVEVHQARSLPVSSGDESEMDREDDQHDDLNESEPSHEDSQDDEESEPHAFGGEETPEEEAMEEKELHPGIAALIAEHLKRK